MTRMTVLPRSIPWYAWLQHSAWLSIVPAFIVCLALAGLHFYQQQQLQGAAVLLQNLGRASRDLSEGFMHFTLGGQAGSPWQPEQGRLLLNQALNEFDTAAARNDIPADIAAQFRAELANLRALLQQSYGTSLDERQRVQLRLALFNVDSRARQIDRVQLRELRELRTFMDRAFGVAFAISILLLSAVCFLFYRTQRRAVDAISILEAISAGSTDAIFAKDTDGKYLLFNRAASEIMGIPSERVVGRDDRSLFTEAEARNVMEHDREVLTTRVTRTFEEDLTTRDGYRTYLATKGPLFDRHGNVSGLFGISRDITERKAAEREVADSRAQLAAVIEALDEGLVSASSDGQLTHWNRAALEMHGFTSEEEALGHLSRFVDMFELLTLDGEPVPLEDWPVNRVRRGERLQNLQLQLRRLDRDWSRIYSYGGTTVHSSDGKPILTLLTISDATPRHRAEEAVRRLQRIEALGTLAAGIAHDFNNILLAISGNARLARQDLPEAHPATAGLVEIERASVRATDLVRRILLFSRAQESQRQLIHLPAVLDEALMLLRSTTPAMVELSKHFAADVPPVNADASQIHQVIVNLLTNSVYAVTAANRANGIVRLELDVVRLGEHDHPVGEELPAGEYVSIAVVDNGCGMGAETLARIFDPFFTTKPQGQGTGLGMSVVHGIVRNHDGGISVESTVGVGTRVEILLPAVRLAETTPAPEPLAADNTIRARKRVLYIDDEEALVMLVDRFLERLGHDVDGFVDAKQAVQAFRERPTAYDVVVTDLAMPAMSGFDVAAEVLSRRPDVLVLMMSGYVRPEDRERALALGIRELILKPSGIEDLADAIDRQLS